MAESTAQKAVGIVGAGLGPPPSTIVAPPLGSVTIGPAPPIAFQSPQIQTTTVSSSTTTTTAAQQASLFPQTTDTTDNGIILTTLRVLKTERGKQGNEKFAIYLENATKSLPVQSNLMSHQSTYSGGGKPSKSSQTLKLQKQLTNILKLASLGLFHCKK